jgi:coenzyme F420-0:L-glutamate ligase/coenzyme F420-1:gamma-L-glutamate ligase
MLVVIPVDIGVVGVGDDLVSRVVAGLSRVGLEEGDVVVVSSKVVYIAYGCVRGLGELEPGGFPVASRYGVDPRVGRLIAELGGEVVSGVRGFILLYRGGLLLPNGGVDLKNAGAGKVVYPCADLREFARSLHRAVLERCGIRVGVVVSDSYLVPLRRGTHAVALATYGFKPVKDYRGAKDLFGREIRYTLQAVADEIACAAHLVMGEADEAKPVAIVRGYRVELIDEDRTNDTIIKPEEDIYGEALFGKSK